MLANYATDRGRQITATPVGHFIGMVGAFLIPVIEGAPVDLCDVFDPGRVLELMESEGHVDGGGPPFFVTSLLDHPSFTEAHLKRIKHVGLGGSTIAGRRHPPTRRSGHPRLPVLWHRASSSPARARTRRRRKRLLTDGNVRPGVEIKLTEEGEILPAGRTCAWATPTTNSPRGRSTARAGITPVTSASSTRRVSDHHRPQGGLHHSRRREHQRAGGRELLLTMPEVAEAVVVATPEPRLVSTRRRCCGSGRPRHADARRGARTSSVRVSPGRSGRRNCTGSTTRAPRAARCRSTWCAGAFAKVA